MTINRIFAVLVCVFFVALTSTTLFAAELESISVTGNVGITLEHTAANGLVGSSSQNIVGDFDGDGIDDFVITVSDENRTITERIFLVYGGNDISGLDNFDLSTLTSAVGITLSLSGFSELHVAAGGDVNNDGLEDFIIGEPFSFDAVGGNSVGKTYVVFGQAGRTTPAIDLDQFEAGDGSLGFVIIGKDAGDASGSSVDGAGDFNNDGFDDILIGAPRSFGNLSNTFLLKAGEAYVVYSPGSALVASIRLEDIATGDGSAGLVAYGGTTNANAGFSVAGLGDVNGDDIDDIAIGSPNYGDTLGAGRAYVLFGGNTSASIELDSLSNAVGFKVNSAADFTNTGTVSAVGDYNGDGLNDLFVGAYGSGVAENQSGSAYVVFGSDGNDRSLVRLSDIVADDNTEGFRVALSSGSTASLLGFRLEGLGDVNGDGMVDLMAVASSVPMEDLDDPTNITFNRTVVFVIYGDSNVTTNMDLEEIRTTSKGLFIYRNVGFSIGGSGDVNGDGVNDIIFGSNANTTEGFQRKSHIMYGSMNLPPRIGNLSPGNGNSRVTLTANGEVENFTFVVEDFETAAAALQVSADSADDSLIAPDGLTLSGIGSERTISMQALPDQLGQTTVTIRVEDANGFVAVRQLDVSIEDRSAPEITLLGDNPQFMVPGAAYVEAGATAFDAFEGDVTGGIVIDASDLDTSTQGSYTVRYTARDSGGAQITVQRTVKVTEIPTISAISDMQVATNGQIEFTVTIGDAETPAIDLQMGITNANAGVVDIVETTFGRDENDPTIRPIRIIPDPTNAGEANLELFVRDELGSIGTSSFILTITDGESPEISINGDNPLLVNPGDSYTDPGAMAMDLVDGDLNDAIVVGGDVVDATVGGSYLVTYTVADDAGNEAQAERSVLVTNAPQLSNIAAVTIQPNERSAQIPFTASDVETADDDLIFSVVSSNVPLLSPGLVSFGGTGSERFLTVHPNNNQLGTSMLTVSVTDADGAQTSTQFEITVADEVAPVITLNGDSAVSLLVGQTYSEQGATAVDAFDGNLSAQLVTSGMVDTSAVGQFTITYSVSDMAGNESVAMRTVSVNTPPPPAPPVTQPSGGGGGGSFSLLVLFILTSIAKRRRLKAMKIRHD